MGQYVLLEAVLYWLPLHASVIDRQNTTSRFMLVLWRDVPLSLLRNSRDGQVLVGAQQVE